MKRASPRSKKNKKTGGSRTVTKTVPQESFFTHFKNATPDDEEEDEEPEDGEMGSGFSTAEEIFQVIKENVVPYGGASYFGTKIPELEADPYEDDDEDDDDMSEEDEEDEEPSPKGKKKGGRKASGKDKKGSGNAGGDPKQEECKNN